MFKRTPKALVRRLDTPYIEHRNTPAEFLEEMYLFRPRLDTAMSHAPMVLDALIESLLPAQAKKPAERSVVWVNPDTSRGKESMGILKEAPGDDAKTIFTAMSPFRNPLEISFLSISEANLWPDVTIEGSRQQQCVKSYMEVAPALGFIVNKLIAQADPVLVLAQETRDLT